MTTTLMPPQVTPQPRASEGRLVRNLITSARSRQDVIQSRAPARGAWLCSLAFGGLLWASFAPLEWGPLAWLALVPLLLLVRIETRTRRMYLAVFGGAWLSIMASMQWIRLGDPTMYLAWLLLGTYMALYVPLFVALTRVAVHRFSVPLLIAAPVLWAGLEYLRGTFMTGFAWYYLAHSQYRWLEIIQISDIVGAYGVSFLIVLTAACLAGLVPERVLQRLRLLPNGEPSAAANSSDHSQLWPVVATLTVFVAVLAYGYVRRARADFLPGPRVGLIQGNFVAKIENDMPKWPDIYRTHHRLTGLAVQHQPDLIVWPEAMFRWPLFEAPPDMTDEELSRIEPRIPPERWRDPMVRKTLVTDSQKAGAAAMIGINAIAATPDGIRQYNSAVFVDPRNGIQGRYDKLHRVPFGEFLPFKETFPWLHKFTPFPPDFGVAAGKEAMAFQYRDWRFAPVICFEDTVPHVVRSIVASTAANGEPVDVLVNLTNDGWFHGSSELNQHLYTAAFRSVECRTPMVRAVNTGISAVIDGDGAIMNPEVFIDGDGQGRTTPRDPKTGQWHKQLNAVIVQTVPLDNRRSLYVRYGDWFAGTCCSCALFLMFAPLIPRRKELG